MRVLVCHSGQERCGVGQYGRALDVSLGRVPDVEVVAFSYADLNAVTATAATGNVALFHFEPGLIGDVNRFQSTVKALRQKGAKIVFCCHMFDAEVQKHYGVLVDRFVLHRTYYGAPTKGVVIPLGCPVYSPAERAGLRAKLGFAEGQIVLTTVGFLTKWKRTPEVADAVASALPPGAMLVHIQAPWPFNPAGAGAAGEDVALKAVAARHVRLHVSTEFLPEDRLLDLVHASDLGFVFHGIDTCSVSAATKAFISGRCPVVVTGSTHASDMIRGVKRVNGLDLRAFGQEVVKVASDPDLLQKLRDGAVKEYERLNMDAVARRYVEEFQRL